jgi:hypothetical protein
MKKCTDIPDEQIEAIDPQNLVKWFNDYICDAFIIESGDEPKLEIKNPKKPQITDQDASTLLQSIEKFARLRNQLYEKSTLLELRREEVSEGDNTDLAILNQAVNKILSRSARSVPGQFKAGFIEYHNLLDEITTKIIDNIIGQGPLYFFTEKGTLNPMAVQDFEELLLLLGDEYILYSKIGRNYIVPERIPLPWLQIMNDVYPEYKSMTPFGERYQAIRDSVRIILNAESGEVEKLADAQRALEQNLGNSDFREILDLALRSRQSGGFNKYFHFDLYILRLMLRHLKLCAYHYYFEAKKKLETPKADDEIVAEIKNEAITDLRDKIVLVIKSNMDVDMRYAQNNANFIKYFRETFTLQEVIFFVDILNDALRLMRLASNLKDLLK